MTDTFLDLTEDEFDKRFPLVTNHLNASASWPAAMDTVVSLRPSVRNWRLFGARIHGGYGHFLTAKMATSIWLAASAGSTVWAIYCVAIQSPTTQRFKYISRCKTMINPEDDFWNNRFHWCVLTAGFLAANEGRLEDSEYVKQLVYEMYEDGAFRDRVPCQPPSGNDTCRG